MTVVWKDVFSSHVAKIGYDEETKELQVEWSNGRVSAYIGVPPDVASEAMNSWSVGGFLHGNIKGFYDHRYLS